MIRIHPVQTGRVRVRPGYLKGNSFTLQLIEALFGSQWGEWMPIYAWLIEHPEGLILVDTGQTAKINEKGYAPSQARQFTGYDVEPEDEIGPQLAHLDIQSSDVSKVILTHLHSDHSGGLSYLGHSDILVDEAEYRVATGPAGRRSGYQPHRWPGWFRPGFLDFEDTPLGAFSTSCPITSDGTVVAVPTPGHSPGHVSVVVKGGSRYVFLGGDLSLTPDTLKANTPFGFATDQSLQTLKRLNRFAQEHATVYLSSHDEDAPSRLASGDVVYG